MSSDKQPNQYKPLPPEDQVLPIIKKYFDLRRSDVDILRYVHAEIDLEVYGMSIKSLRRLKQKHGLVSTRQQAHTIESIAPYVSEVRTRLPAIGAGDMVSALWHDHGIRAPHGLVLAHDKAVDPVAVAARKRKGLKRRRFWATGVNDVWSFDQHDKWKRFGLMLHLCVEVFSGKLLWLKVWWSNRQPPLLASYYLEAARECGGVCLVTQSDPGGENYGIANPHTVIRQHLDPSLAGTIQHRWMRKGVNVKSEIKWSVFRRQFAPGFEGLLEYGLTMDIYKPTDALHVLIFRWLVIPWMQLQMDNYRIRSNQKLPRKNNKKVLPHGIPDLIFERPQDYMAADYKVRVDEDLLDAAQEKYAPADHPVFQLVPPIFDARVQAAYATLGRPAVTVNTLWTIYSALLNEVSNHLTPGEQAIVYGISVTSDEAVDFLPELPGEYVPWPNHGAQNAG
ncbi:hypothetical protein AURDEDRAFT_76626 [Auricularia subglabra TFB-10046 SS5]|uniref:Integrase core domain-containing protein n=1 Tax=Auricularia subglabra (strain TFB-10046 / SS5) TaxID=717982 RepID=J0WNC0_AURST|nr:hypothetical protein AURDEDRAFT_76626 [Auricularia subglabra TFB-10046 SS5]